MYRVLPVLLQILFLVPVHSQELPVQEAINYLVRAEQDRLYIVGGDPDKLPSDKESDLSKKYSPLSKPIFSVKSYWVDESLLDSFELESLSSDTQKMFKKVKNGKAQYRLIVHPQSEFFYEGLIEKGVEEAESFLATPTASPRSLIIWSEASPHTAFLVKVSLDAMVGEALRTIRSTDAPTSIGASQIFEKNREILIFLKRA